MRSRVIPGSSPTIDRRDPVSRLKSVDLPTFGRPQTAIRGSSRESMLSVSVTICDASNSISRHSCSSSFPRKSSRSPRPAIFVETGVCRPTIPSFGRGAATFFPATFVPARLAEVFLTLSSFAERRTCFFPFVPSASMRIVFRLSFSGDRVGRFESLFASAFLLESTLRFRGSTAPVVGVDFGARPCFGRVAAVRCFLPNRFFSSFLAFAIVVPSLATPGASIHYREPAITFTVFRPIECNLDAGTRDDHTDRAQPGVGSTTSRCS